MGISATWNEGRSLSAQVQGPTVIHDKSAVTYTEQRLTPEQQAQARANIGALKVPCITGEGAPTEETEGAVGSLYMDTDGSKYDLYICKDVRNGFYYWIKLHTRDHFMFQTSVRKDGTVVIGVFTHDSELDVTYSLLCSLWDMGCQSVYALVEEANTGFRYKLPLVAHAAEDGYIVFSAYCEGTEARLTINSNNEARYVNE